MLDDGPEFLSRLVSNINRSQCRVTDLSCSVLPGTMLTYNWKSTPETLTLNPKP